MQLTGVRMTPDLGIAHVHYRIFGDELNERTAQKVLTQASPFFRRKLARSMKMRTTPEVRFHFDASPERYEHIEEVLDNLRERGEMGSDNESE